jgi:hypothetical protein
MAISQTGIANGIKLAIEATTFTVSYVTAAPLTEAINRTDTQNLKEMQKELSQLSKILNIRLTIIEKYRVSCSERNQIDEYEA